MTRATLPRYRRALAVGALILVGCQSPDPRPAEAAVAAVQPTAPDRVARAEFEAIEQRVGGRLGVAVIDADGAPVVLNRQSERFAMCSSFKLALAAMALDMVDKGRATLAQPITFGRADMVPYAPVMETRFTGDVGRTTLEDAARAGVVTSDNVAANLVLQIVGGPAGFTRAIRAWGDTITRLDRTEPTLNTNVPGDPRDTSTPLATADVVRRLTYGAVLTPTSTALLKTWASASETGLRRVRAGLPASFRAGDKTGTCAPSDKPNPEFNDIGWFETPSGGRYAFVVYLAHSTARGAAADSALADAGRIAARLVR